MITNKRLKILLIIQACLYLLAIFIILASSNDGPEDFSGIIAIVPLWAFHLLGFANLVFMLSYLIDYFKKKTSRDVLLIALAIINLLMAVLYVPLYRLIT